MIKEPHLNYIMIIIQIPTILCFMAPCLHVFSAVNPDIHVLSDTTL